MRFFEATVSAFRPILCPRHPLFYVVSILLICASASRAGAASQEKLEKAFASLQQADAQIPADSYDPVAVVKAAEARPDDLFNWVRDNTRWVPYRGALRGPVGVLVDRLGNSLDRSLLLAEFYKHTTVKVRLAHAKLSDEQAKTLYEKLRAAPHAPGIAFTPADGNGAAGEAASQKLQRLGESVTQNAGAETKALVAALSPGKAPSPSEADAISTLADHWWLQRADGATWVDLDVTLPGGKPGDSVAPAAETFSIDDLPADLWHTLRITVIAEQWADGKLTESKIISRSVRPGLVFGATIFITHQPLDWPSTPQAGGGAEAARQLRTAALTPTEWVPALRLGAETAIDAGIRSDGSMDPKPQLDATARAGSAAAKGAKAAASAFDAAFGDTPAPAPPAGVFTAEWIEYTVHSPGAADETIRREVFDLIGPAARAGGVTSKPNPSDLDRANAALALRGRIDIVALPAQPSPHFVGHLVLSSLLNARPDIEKSLEATQTPSGGQAEFDSPPLCPASLYGLSLVRRLYSPWAAEWYIARPNVFSQHSFTRLTDDDHQVFVDATDLITNDVAIEPGSKADPARVRLEQGVIDTVAEGAFVPEGAQHTSASQALAAATSQSVPWRVVRAAADVEQLKLPANDMARIRAEVSAGRTVVVPTASVKLANHDAVAWWSIDPATGRTIGMGECGWGVSLAEYAQRLQQIVLTRQRFVCLAAGVVTVANTVSPLFHLSELNGDALSAMQTALDAACISG